MSDPILNLAARSSLIGIGDALHMADEILAAELFETGNAVPSAAQVDETLELVADYLDEAAQWNGLTPDLQSLCERYDGIVIEMILRRLWYSREKIVERIQTIAKKMHERFRERSARRKARRKDRRADRKSSNRDQQVAALEAKFRAHEDA